MDIRTRDMAAIRKNAAGMDFGQMQTVFAPYLRLPETFGGTLRESIYTHTRVFFIFLAQILSADRGCGAAVQAFLAWFNSLTGKQASPQTGAYCQARKALPLKDVEALHAPLADALDRGDETFLGRRVQVVDGSSLSMPDTPQNQKRWPQPSSQTPGCGFPVMRIVGLFSLATGIWRGVAFSALATAERTLFRNLWDQFAWDDIALADTGFCSYADYVLLERRGVDSVMLNHQRRTKGLREIEKFGENDRLVEWQKGKQRPNWLTKEQWDELPETFLVREITADIAGHGFRTQKLVIATTLRDPKRYPADQIVALYRRRWNIELYFRDIKISMGMDVLRCKSPDMVEKEVWMHVIAYNLIRALMRDAAKKHGAPLDRISFKGTCDAVRNWAPVIAEAKGKRRAALIDAMIHSIALNIVPHRPDRTEPRAKKRRPKNYQLLTKPRKEFKESPHRGKYRPAAA